MHIFLAFFRLLSTRSRLVSEELVPNTSVDWPPNTLTSTQS